MLSLLMEWKLTNQRITQKLAATRVAHSGAIISYLKAIFG